MAVLQLTDKVVRKQNSQDRKALTVQLRNETAENALKNTNDSVIKRNGKALKATAIIKTENFEGTAGFTELENKMNALMEQRKLNAAQFSEDDYYKLVQYTLINLNRRVLQQRDLTTFMDMIINNPNFSKVVEFQDVLPFGAIFKDHTGTGENVSLIVTETGDKDTIRLGIKAVGWKDTLLNELFNQDMAYISKVLDAVAVGWVACRNNDCIGPIITTTYDASQKIPANTTGSTTEEKFYLTIYAAIKKAKALKDPLTDDEIDTDGMSILVNPVNDMDIERSINGVINVNGEQVNRTALTQIETMIPYKKKTIRNGKDAVVYPGVPAGKAYLVIPKAHRYTLIKRGLTQQISAGEALKLDREDRAWYGVTGSYYKLFFGSSDADTKAAIITAHGGDGAGYGYVLEITLPS